MARKLTAHLLAALKAEFPFLAGWEPEIHSAYRPVTFQVARVLDPNTVWSLEFGRRNNYPDPSYTKGVTCIATSNGITLEWHRLAEGETTPADVMKDDTSFVLVCDEFRSQLVRNDPGDVRYTLYKRGAETVDGIREQAVRAGLEMHAELES